MEHTGEPRNRQHGDLIYDRAGFADQKGRMNHGAGLIGYPCGNR